MAGLLDNKLYQDDIAYVAGLGLPWEKLQDSSFIISGATGLLGSFLTDVLMHKNADGLNCHIYALGRNQGKARKRFDSYFENPNFSFIECDVNDASFVKKLPDHADYIFHAAGNVHPLAYATDPIGTITANIFAANSFLEYCATHNVKRFAFSSSSEVYGKNRGDVELFDESYCGYIDCNTVRAGYPESKRCSEALCQSYIAQKGVDAVLVRFSHSYGPTVLATDTKAMTQFINNGLNKEDIVLKSDGSQYFSYTYTADAISGLLTIILKGENGQAYNIADETGDTTLKNLAQSIADYCGTKLKFDIPSDTEKAGYTTATKARLDGTKLRSLGWKPRFDIKEGVQRTIKILSA